jgi:hypothetical protein
MTDIINILNYIFNFQIELSKYIQNNPKHTQNFN